MQVTINTENRNGRVRNFWKHIHFHSTDAGELQLHSPEEMIFPDGFFTRDLVMTHNAVSLLEFLPEQGGCREGATGKGCFSHASGGSPADNGRKTVS